MGNLIFILGFLGVIGIFSFFYFGGKKKDQLEEGKTPLLQEQCGGRFDGLNFTIPFVRHALYDEFIVIAYGKKRYILKYTDINSANVKRHLFSKGITYAHNREDLPRSIIIWSRSTDEVIDLLNKNNVQVN